ncbi:MAG TPA: methyltransferase domain-containing protein, partial [Vicinamibacteria bacterium]
RDRVAPSTTNRPPTERAHPRAVAAHYAPGDPQGAVLAALRAAGRDGATLAPDDLAPLDQLHPRGTAATRELARLAQLQPGQAVLDVGGGLGGPARTLAREFGCAVTVVDLTAAYCRLGRGLTARAGPERRVGFLNGDALALPCRDAAFDVVRTQASAMNIADQGRLCAEANRALRPGGRLALREPATGRRVPPHFPVPWAADQALSYLRPPEALRTLLWGVGLVELAWADATAATLAWYGAAGACGAARPAPVPLGLELLLGPAARTMVANLVRNLAEGRLAMVEGVFARPQPDRALVR